MIAKREIYSVVFNQTINKDGIRRMYIYTLGVPSANELKTPLKITKRDDLITVEFTDHSRHILHFNSDTELFDRLIETKPKKSESSTNN